MRVPSFASRNAALCRVLVAGVPGLLALSACGEQGARPTLSAAPAAVAAPVQAPGAAMEDGERAFAPQGWLEYCTRNQADPSCRAAAFTPERAQQLKHVQAMIRKIPARSDEKLFGVSEFWQVANRKSGGDCEDIALAAREQLLALGWPLSSLRLATAFTEQREFHLVLTVDVLADGKLETLVVDNRWPQVQSYAKLREIGYRFETRQMAMGAGWVQVRDASLPRTEMASLQKPEPSLATAATGTAKQRPVAVASMAAPVGPLLAVTPPATSWAKPVLLPTAFNSGYGAFSGTLGYFTPRSHSFAFRSQGMLTL